MVAAYGGVYAACATGGNGFARDFLAGLAALYADPRKSHNTPCTLPIRFQVVLTKPLSPLGTVLTRGFSIVYTGIGSSHQLAWASTLLGCLAFLLIIPIYVFYYYGPKIRAKSPYAQQVLQQRERAESTLPHTQATQLDTGAVLAQ